MSNRAPSIVTAVRAIGIGLILIGMVDDSSSSAGSRTRPPSLAVLTGPLAFEPNRGQAEPSVRFQAHGPGYGISLTPTAMILSLRSGRPEPEPGGAADPLERIARLRESAGVAGAQELRLQLVGANSSPALAGRDLLPGHVNYLQGSDPENWLTRVPTFARVRHRGVYPGIDLEYYGVGGQLEFDFIVQPGADPSVIEFVVEGASRVVLEDGDLVLQLGDGELRLREPAIYQPSESGASGKAREAISGGFVKRGRNRIGFELEAYDPTRPLVIDPRVIYSTYLGFTNREHYLDVATSGDGDAYVVGSREGAVHFAVVVHKLSARGSGPEYTTILDGTVASGGGSLGADEFGLSIAADADGNVYLTGQTYSLNFPVLNAAQSSIGSSNGGDAFAAKLDPDGILLYSTYLGGTGFDFGIGVDVDPDGNAYVTGLAGVDFPFTIPTAAGGAFVTKYAPDGALVHTVCAGCGVGFNRYVGADIAVDALGQAYVTGYTGTNFLSNRSVFVTKLLSDGSSDYSQTLGSSGDDDLGFGIAVDQDGNAYVTGQTSSFGFPSTAGAFQEDLLPAPFCFGQCTDAFVTKLDPGGSIVYSTFLGGDLADTGHGIAVDLEGRASVIGSTGSTDFPTRNPLQAGFAGGGRDAFVTRLTADGSALSFSTYLGGSGFDGSSLFFPEKMGIARYGRSNLLLAGTTDSPNFPTQDAAQPGLGGELGGFVVSLFDQPVVFVPGAAGSVLIDRANNDEELWLGPVALPSTVTARWRKLSLYPSDNPGNHTILASEPLRSVPGGEIYGPLLDRFKREGYVTYPLLDEQGDFDPTRMTLAGCDTTPVDGDTPDLFLFPSDWRLDMAENALRLFEYIECVQSFRPNTPITIVAHSMGSLLARRYILDHPDDHRLNTLITIAGPYLGAPKLINVLETGAFLPNGILSNAFLPIIGSLTGPHQLLPSRRHFDLNAELFAIDILSEKDRDLNGDGVSPQIYSYDQMIDFLDSKGREGFLPGTAVDRFHTLEQDDWRADATGIEYRHILGRQAAPSVVGGLVATYRTQCRIVIRLPVPILSCKLSPILDVVMTPGDGTVSTLSASRIGGTTDLNAPGAELRLFAVSDPKDDKTVEHNGLLANPDVQDQVLRWLRGGDTLQPASASNAVFQQARVEPVYRLVTISGVDSVIVEDGSGNSTALVGGIIAGSVPGVSVLALGERVYLVAIPESGTENYRIRFTSTDEPLGVEILLGTSNVTTRAIRYNDVEVPAAVDTVLTLDSMGLVELGYDEDGDGMFESVVVPTADVSGTPAGDVDGPSIAVLQTLQPGGSALITLSAEDPSSGVASLFYSLNGSDYQAYTAPFSVDTTQTPVLFVIADDGVANRSTRVQPLPEPSAAILGLCAIAAVTAIRRVRGRRRAPEGSGAMSSGSRRSP